MGNHPIHRYVDGSMYQFARGRSAPAEAVEDLASIRSKLAVVDLDGANPSVDEFLERIVRELKIRCFQPNTQKQYTSVVRSFLSWCGVAPQQADREHVRDCRRAFASV